MTFDTADAPSAQFLRETAAKHFVCMTFRAVEPDGSSRLAFASCFLVEIESHWLLITAGHVITRIREGCGRGTVYSEFTLRDKLAGNQFPFGVPIPFDDDAWIVFDSVDADLAGMPLRWFFVDQLKAGGISAIGEVAWGPPPFDDFDHWLLTGIPAESYEQVGSQHVLKLTIVPLQPTQPPASVGKLDTSGVVGAIAADFPAQYGKIITQPDLDTVYVADVAGMSGSPVYGVKAVDGKVRYWLLGVESAWFAPSRTVKFHPSICFLTAFKEAIRQLEAREDAERANG